MKQRGNAVVWLLVALLGILTVGPIATGAFFGAIGAAIGTAWSIAVGVVAVGAFLFGLYYIYHSIPVWRAERKARAAHEQYQQWLAQRDAEMALIGAKQKPPGISGPKKKKRTAKPLKPSDAEPASAERKQRANER